MWGVISTWSPKVWPNTKRQKICGHLPPPSLLVPERNCQVPNISPTTCGSSSKCSLTALCARSVFTIPTTEGWACCARHLIPATQVSMENWLEMKQMGAWQEHPRGEQAYMPAAQSYVNSAEHHFESKKWKAGLPHRAREETSHDGWGQRTHEPRSHRLGLPVTNASPDGPRNCLPLKQ